MSRLALTLTPSPYEPATSFASRLAQRNGHGRVQDFVLDMGLNWQAIAGGHRPEIVELAAIAGADPGPLIQFTPFFGEGQRITLAGEAFFHKSFEVKAFDICPLCVKEARTDDGQALSAGAKGWWPLRYARACDRHGVHLLSLPPPELGRHKHDYAGRVHDCAKRIMSAADNIKPADVQAFDRYFTDRIAGEVNHAHGWLDGVELSVVSQVCEALGLLILDGPTSRPTGKSKGHLARATNRGYAALAGGRDSLWPRLRDVLRRSTAARGRPNTDFLHLQNTVSRLPSTSGVELLREELRTFCVEHYPLGPGDTVYGVRVTERTLHSPSTIASAFGCPIRRTTRLMRDFRKLGPPAGLPSPDHRLQIPAEPWQKWIEVYQRSMNTKDAANRLGVCRDFFDKMIRAGWIIPFFELEGHQTRYDPLLIDQLPTRFFRRCKTVDRQPADRQPLFNIAPICKVSPLDVLRAVEDGGQVIGTKHADATALKEIFVDREQVLDAFEGPPISGITYEQARKHLRTGNFTLIWLMREGILPVTRSHHPRTRISVNRFSDEAMQAFDAQYRTPGQIAAAKQTSVHTILAELRAMDIPHIAVPSKVTPIYRITDLPQAYR